MAHLGKYYPVLNRSRVLALGSTWPFFGPTEYFWLTGSWGGAGAGVMPGTGRSILPTAYVHGETSITWTGQMAVYLGTPITLTVNIGFDNAAGDQPCFVSMDWGTVNQMRTTAAFPHLVDWEYIQIPFFGPEVTVNPLAVVFAQVDWEVFAVPWTVNPKPPHSTPF